MDANFDVADEASWQTTIDRAVAEIRQRLPDSRSRSPESFAATLDHYVLTWVSANETPQLWAAVDDLALTLGSARVSEPVVAARTAALCWATSIASALQQSGCVVATEPPEDIAAKVLMAIESLTRPSDIKLEERYLQTRLALVQQFAVPPRPPRPATRHDTAGYVGGSTRDLIVRAARDIFGEQGFYDTTIEQIAKRAHVSVGTIYTYFPGKAGLVLHFVTAGLDALDELMERGRQNPSPLARVQSAGDAYFQFAVAHPIAARFAAVRVLQPASGAEYEELNRLCSERVQKLVLSIAGDVAEAMSAGEIPEGPIDEAMIFLWGLWNGTVALMLRTDDLAIAPEAARRAIEFGRRKLDHAASWEKRSAP